MVNFTDIELPKMHNIAELEAVSVKEDIKTEQRGEDDDQYVVNFVVRNNKEYRIPNSVIKQVQELVLKEKIKTFKVIKTGEGMQTKYSVRVLE